ncbi:MAG: hypothetical protein LBV72_19830 [Tannerella sp.]|jgi:hypothetical protein|nr:hypothetical protein [Tannerella sp.]
MKKALLLLFIIPLISSCSNDDDNGGYDNKKTFEKSNIVGDWLFSEYKSVNGGPISSSLESRISRLIFDNNGNITVRDEVYNKDLLTGTWVFDGKNIITCEVKYENKLLEQDTKTIQYKLVDLSANEIVVQTVYNDNNPERDYAKYIKDPNAPDNILGTIDESSVLAFDGLNVINWRKEDKIDFYDAYTLLDTIFSNRTINAQITYLYNDGDDVKVNWSTNGEIIKIEEETRQWYSDKQKWTNMSIATIKVTADKNFKYGADIIFPTRTVKRLKTIPQINTLKDESDIFGFNFGTNKSDIELTQDYAPTLALAANKYAEYSYMLEFENTKLIRIYCTSFGYDRLSGMAKRLKIPEPLQVSNDKILNPQEWDNGILKFKAFEADFSAYPGVNPSFPCISIEKL